MKKNIFTLLVFVSLTLSGCRDWLDINENPNYVSKADKTTLLPTVALMTADKVGYELTLTGYFWAQYTVQNRNTSQYTTVMNYDLNTQSAYFTSPWSYLYVRVLPSVRTILEQCEGESGVSNFVLEAKTMLAYNLYLLTSLYDKVAYTDGYLNPENTTPGFDSGEQMQGIITGILEEIRSMNAGQLAADEQANTSVKADMIFGGDVEQWVKFANTLYLRVLLRDFDTNRSKIQSLLAENNLLDTQDAAFDNFSNEPALRERPPPAQYGSEHPLLLGHTRRTERNRFAVVLLLRGRCNGRRLRNDPDACRSEPAATRRHRSGLFRHDRRGLFPQGRSVRPPERCGQCQE